MGNGFSLSSWVNYFGWNKNHGKNSIEINIENRSSIWKDQSEMKKKRFSFDKKKVVIKSMLLFE